MCCYQEMTGQGYMVQFIIHMMDTPFIFFCGLRQALSLTSLMFGYQVTRKKIVSKLLLGSSIMHYFVGNFANHKFLFFSQFSPSAPFYLVVVYGMTGGLNTSFLPLIVSESQAVTVFSPFLCHLDLVFSCLFYCYCFQNNDHKCVEEFFVGFGVLRLCFLKDACRHFWITLIFQIGITPSSS